ncbi:MAG TPA: type II secretion system protein [Longimicrobiales bacterium]|nr:type II secretion system protein [Longimicrobiales bacterium]
MTPETATSARPARPARRAGFSLIELIWVLSLIGILVSMAAPRYTEYRNRIAADQAASAVGNFVALARSYAIQTRTATTLKVTPGTRRVAIEIDGETIRELNLGPGGDFELDTLDMDMTGDSITFTARGICQQCGVSGTGAVVVAGHGSAYVVTFNAVGVWKKTSR